MGKKSLCVAVVAVGLLLGACGSGSKHSSTNTSTTTSTTTGSTTTSGQVSKKPKKLAELLRVSKAGLTPAQPSASVKAPIGASVTMETELPGTGKTPPQRVQLTIQKGPAAALAVKIVSQSGATTQATIASANGQPITMYKPHFTCTIPPAATFCPALSLSGTSSVYSLAFAATPSTPIVISGLVEPATGGPAIRTAVSTGQSAPPFQVATLVTARAPAQTGSKTKPTVPTPAASASVHANDSVSIRTKVTGAAGAKPQAVTFTIGHGPSKTLTVTASVKGGKSSTATLKSANGKPLTLLYPHFTCELPPTPSICPPSLAHTGVDRYTLAFNVPAGISISLSAKVGPG